jgi:hypothetical protein
VTLKTGQVISATWNSNPSWPQANVMIMKPASSNSNLAAGQSTTFGFSVKRQMATTPRPRSPAQPRNQPNTAGQAGIGRPARAMA